MALLKIQKNQETGEYQIIDNLAHESLNDYDIAFSKGYVAASDGLPKEEVEQMQTHENPEYDKGLLEGWAQYHVDQYRDDTEEASIMMHDARQNLKQAIFQYTVNKNVSAFKAVMDAYQSLRVAKNPKQVETIYFNL